MPINIEMFETMAQGQVPLRNGQPVFLDEGFFARVVADGWEPRNPAGADEVAGLDSFVVGSTGCLVPLLLPGDTIYVDRTASAQPGDIVGFKLSARGAEAQNSSPIADSREQPLWRAGDRWAKLFVRSNHGVDMLLERFGNAATATLLACESPEQIPVLHPVRNVMRDGKLLFQPPIHSPQVSANAVSQMISNYGFSTVTVNNNITQGVGSSTDVNVISASITTTGSPVAIDVTSTVTLTGGGVPASSFTACTLEVWMDGASIGSTKWDGKNLANFGGGSTPPAIPVTLSATHTPSAGVHTYSLHAHVAGAGSVWSCTMACDANFIKVREIKK